MDAASPKCPNCHAAVLPDWDWCQACGYDPDSLRPAGWISPSLYLSDGASEAAGGGGTATATKRRRGRKGRKAESEAASPPTPLIELPADLAPAVDPISDGRSIVSHAGPMASPAPARTTAPAAPAPTSGSTLPARVPAAATATPTSAPAAGPSPAGPPAGRTLLDPAALGAAAGDHPVYRVQATPPELIGAGVLLLAAAGLAYLTVRGILQVATGASTSALDNIATVVFVVVCAVIAFAAAVQGLALVRQRVELVDGELVAHNRFGRVQRVPVNEIYAIRLSQRQYATPRGLSQAIETPYVQRSYGTGFWLDALGGRSPGAGPSDAQLVLFEQLTAAVDRRRPPRPSLPNP